jgi:hypothetical protein
MLMQLDYDCAIQENMIMDIKECDCSVTFSGVCVVETCMALNLYNWHQEPTFVVYCNVARECVHLQQAS